jgi:hypothetical protein
MAPERKSQPVKKIIRKNFDTLKMHEENLHITPDPTKGFPQPDIPADEAWNNMAGLLDTAMPVSPPEPPSEPGTSPSAGGGIFGGSSHITGIILGVIGVAGLLTWGVISLTNKPGTSPTIKNTTNALQNEAVTDSSTLVNQNNASFPGKIKSPETIDYQDTKKNLTENQLTGEKQITSGSVSMLDIEKRVKEKPTSTYSPVPELPVKNPAAIEPAKMDNGAIITSVKDIPVQQLVNEDKFKDTMTIAEFQSLPFSPDIDSVISTGKKVPGDNIPSNPAGNDDHNNENKSSGNEKSKKSAQMPKNICLQMAINGNIGLVVQKGRDPNMFYGGLITGGLWNEKLKGGIETGVGYEVYEDYGSVTENIRIDSIPTDTLGSFEYLDSTRMTAYKYQYHYLQVPLFITKQLVSKERFSLDIKTGPMVGFRISDRKTLDYISGPTGGEVLSTVNNDYSRLKISWQWQLMLQLKWNFNERLSLSLSPYGIFYLNNLYDKKNRPANIPFSFGVYAGLIYRFK